MLEMLYNSLFINDDILFFEKDFDNVTFFANELVILNINLDKINLDDVDFYEDDPKTIIHIRLFAWRNKSDKPKTIKKDLSKGLMPAAWHPTR